MNVGGGGTGGQMSFIQLLDFAFRYGLSSVISLFLVWIMATQIVTQHENAAQQHNAIVSQLQEVQRTQLEISRQLERNNNNSGR